MQKFIHKYIFLDFDGVLRRLTSDPSKFDLDCLTNFEAAVRQCGELGIVITSTWRLVMSIQDIRCRFSQDIAMRIVGMTPCLDSRDKYGRYQEVCLFLKKHSDLECFWLAIDDDAEQFPANINLLLTDPSCGFDADCEKKLITFFQR